MVYIRQVLFVFIDVLSLLILIRVLLSWFPRVPYNRLTQFIDDITGPILRAGRRLIPPIGGVMDISAVLILVGLDLAKTLISNVLV